ncbi:hypothetical protein [Geodermatophilus siccatus]|nr:hypothetical protein [Geodermatophilus siccatus]
MTIRWLTDADRRDIRNAQEEVEVLSELMRRYAPPHVMTPEERERAIADYRAHGERPSGLPIDPNRRG